MIKLTTMTVQLIDCRPDGIRICHVEGESLITVVVPRDLLSKAKQLPDIPKRGIYYLLDEGHGVISRVYAGQTTQGLRRLDAHKSAKDFWNTSVMFLDDEVNIDRDVLDALEANAIDYVRTHGSYETDNSATPQPYVSPYRPEPALEHPLQDGGPRLRPQPHRGRPPLAQEPTVPGGMMDGTTTSAASRMFLLLRASSSTRGKRALLPRDATTSALAHLSCWLAHRWISPGPCLRVPLPQTEGASSLVMRKESASWGTIRASTARARRRCSCWVVARTAGSSG
mgnify:CR=1 FL=1